MPISFEEVTGEIQRAPSTAEHRRDAGVRRARGRPARTTRARAAADGRARGARLRRLRAEAMSESSVSQSAIFSARPTLRIAGQPDERASALLTAMKMEESRRRYEHPGAACHQLGGDRRRPRRARIRRQLGFEARRRAGRVHRRRGHAARDLQGQGQRAGDGVQLRPAARARRARRRRADGGAARAPQQDLRGHVAGRRGQCDRRRSRPHTLGERPDLAHRHLGAAQRDAICRFCAACWRASMPTCRSSAPTCRCRRART